MIKRVLRSATTMNGAVIVESDSLDKSKPVIGCMLAHGIGERGNDLAVVENFITGQCQNLISLINSANIVLIAPQLETGNWTPNYFDFTYNYLTTNYPVGTKVFISGISLGGQEIWQWGSLNNAKVTGIIGCCPVFVTVDFCQIKCPVIVFQAKNDSIVSFSQGQSAVNSINACNPPQPAKMVPYDFGDHYIWNTVYGDSQCKSFLGLSGTTPTPIPTPSPTPTPTPMPATTLKADASATVTNVVGTTAVLDGSRSTGYLNVSGFKALSWEVISGPEWNVFPNYDKIGERKNIINLKPGTYVFRLTARDSIGNKSTSDVTIVVVAATGKEVLEENVIAGKPAIIYKDFTWAYK